MPIKKFAVGCFDDEAVLFPAVKKVRKAGYKIHDIYTPMPIHGLDTAMGLDTGFRKSTRKGFLPRMTDALAENITSRTRTGKRVISVPRISGVYASRIISAEAWYPARYNYKDGLRSGTHWLLAGFGINLIREFIINR